MGRRALLVGEGKTFLLCMKMMLSEHHRLWKYRPARGGKGIIHQEERGHRWVGRRSGVAETEQQLSAVAGAEREVHLVVEVGDRLEGHECWRLAAIGMATEIVAAAVTQAAAGRR